MEEADLLISQLSSWLQCGGEMKRKVVQVRVRLGFSLLHHQLRLGCGASYSDSLLRVCLCSDASEFISKIPF